MQSVIKSIVFGLVFCVAAVAATLCTTGTARAGASTCGTPTVSSGPAVSLSTTIDVFTAPTVLGPFTVTGNCTGGSGNSTVTITIAFDNGLNPQSDGNRAMNCTTGCGVYSGDKYEYYLCGTSTCPSTDLANGGTITTTCTIHASVCTGTPGWSATFYVLALPSTAGGVNDVTVGTYSDTVGLTVTAT